MTAIISADNGQVTNSPGLKYSGSDNSGVLALQSGANVTALTLNADQTSGFTGQVNAPEIFATNGLIVTTATINSNYVIAAGTNAMSVGPVTVAASATVFVSSGTRWLVL